MKLNFVNKITRIAYIFIFSLLPTVMFAPPIPPPTQSTDPIAPIDGGILFLFVAGISFGIYQIMQLRKKQLI